jgi:ribosomal protein S6
VTPTNNKSKETNDVCTEITKQTQVDECYEWGAKILKYQIK